MPIYNKIRSILYLLLWCENGNVMQKVKLNCIVSHMKWRIKKDIIYIEKIGIEYCITF